MSSPSAKSATIQTKRWFARANSTMCVSVVPGVIVSWSKSSASSCCYLQYNEGTSRVPASLFGTADPVFSFASCLARCLKPPAAGHENVACQYPETAFDTRPFPQKNMRLVDQRDESIDGFGGLSRNSDPSNFYCPCNPPRTVRRGVASDYNLDLSKPKAGCKLAGKSSFHKPCVGLLV